MPTMTPRQREVLQLLNDGLQPAQIATQLGVSRNAIYQQIHSLRKRGHLPAGWTPSGRPPRSEDSQVPGVAVLQSLLSTETGVNDEDVSVITQSVLIAELTRVRDVMSEQVRILNAYLPH